MLSFRKAQLKDVKLYFNWANDPTVREQSYKSDLISFENHYRWFENRINDNSSVMLVFSNEQNLFIGQIRIEKKTNNESIIGISVDSNHRGNGYAKEMLKKSSDYFLLHNPNFVISAFIKEINLSSKYAFEKAGFNLNNIVIHENFKSFHYTKKNQ